MMMMMMMMMVEYDRICVNDSTLSAITSRVSRLKTLYEPKLFDWNYM